MRAAWDRTFAERDRLSIASEIDDQRLFQVMFGYAGRLSEGEEYDPADGRAFIAETLDRYLK